MEKTKNLVKNFFNNEYMYRSCVILIKGNHGTGKTYILRELMKEFSMYNPKLISFNKYLLEKISNKKVRKSYLTIFRELIDSICKEKGHHMILIDNLEEYYSRIKPKQFKELILTCIHKSRQYKVGKYHIIIILTFPISPKFKSLDSVISSFNNIKNSINIIEL